MSKKQIKEMAKVIDAMEGGNAYIECFDNAFADADKIAEVLYNAGYRKQSEGEWIFKRTYYEADECNCSVCGQLMTTAKGVRMNYCPNCGAKMKGGAE